MAAKKPERREYPRIKDSDISIELSGEGVNTISQSLDVSASGIYCKVDRRIPVMTRVKLSLNIPVKTGASSKKLEIDGVVVREHPVMKDGRAEHYDVAIFFDSLLPKERKILTDYIENRS
ncbi:MAG: hypothetical protein GF408_02255 [Candidatus Omnitrophica bacterium]|nr:hypothetical protein [Candidatus Omnitrophota bacterium]